MSASLSVIIPTFMRHQVLWKTIEDLAPQFQSKDELIIVDQNSPALTLPPHLQFGWIRLIPLKTPSLTRARNLGIAHARHGLLIFLDDDIIPSSKLLERFRHLTQLYENCILTGKVDQEDKADDIPYPGFVDLQTGEIRTQFSQEYSGETPFFPGGLALIPRSCLPPPPYFCPSFRGASQGEEIDFAMRVRKQRVRIISDSEIQIYHLKVLEGGCRAPHFQKKFYRDQVFNQALFYGRHGHLIHLPKCLRRLKNFIEFHSRKNQGTKWTRGKLRHRHSWISALAASFLVIQGLITGLRLRLPSF